MRMYLKLFLMIAVFAITVALQSGATTSDLADDARVTWVCGFGSAADYEALIDDFQRMRAHQQDTFELYLAGKRYDQCIAECDAARGCPVTADQLARIAADAFGPHIGRQL